MSGVFVEMILPFDVGIRKPCCMGLCTNWREAGQAKQEKETNTD